MEKFILVGIQKNTGIELFKKNEKFEIFYLTESFSTIEEIFEHINDVAYKKIITCFAFGTGLLYIMEFLFLTKILTP